MASGIDAWAQRGALDIHGRTFSVLGCGVNVCYPRENYSLYREIAEGHGGLISEFTPDALPLSWHFPIRNRLISGLSDGVLLIEATLRSGTQSTVNHALEQGRMVFALPGNVDAPGSELPLRLLKDGAELCTCASDILTHLKVTKPVQEHTPAPQAAPLDDPVLRALEREDKTFEELLEETGLPAAQLTAKLSLMELDGQIDRLPGRAYAIHR